MSGYILLVLLLCVAIGIVFAVRRARRHLAKVHGAILAAPAPRDVSAALPEPVAGFAARGGAMPGDLAQRVTFSQDVQMMLKPGAGWQALEAHQTMATGQGAFVWVARQPLLARLLKFRVVDAFVGHAGRLDVWLFGVMRIVRARGDDIDRGEAMRYLAELPWAPDAILGNPDLTWRMAGDGWAEVTMPAAGGPVLARFRFDDEGDIVEVFAPARPTTDASGKRVLRDWSGVFSDYRWIGARRIPAEGSVGYVGQTGVEPYFQARITEYIAHH